MDTYKRGSEWRRWDLHIHTPETKKNDQYQGANAQAKWDNFYNDINNYIEENNPIKNIAVIGITDYLSIDNYNKIVNDNKLPSSIKLVLPNIELRLIPIANDAPLNIHVICNPKIVSELESRFFSKLILKCGNSSFDATKSGLIRYGKYLDSGLNDSLAYKKGLEMFVPSFDALKSIFEGDSDLKENLIIAVSNSSNDGASGITCNSDYLCNNGESQLMGARLAVYKFSDLIFSANKSDIEYFLGKKEKFPIDKVVKSCGSLKPCIHGSDAHTNTKIFEPDNKRYCWIKADPTFNGLKQIIYEPEERVRICDTKPETKPDYFVIDRIEYNDPDFQSEPIYFNDKLTCIIGGKSTGKSILIQNLAMNIDAEETNKCLAIANSKTLNVNDVKVFWKDGTTEQRKIVYIPQTYLNRLSDEQQEKTEIDNLIHSMMLNNIEIKKAQDNFELNVNNYKVTIEKNIIDLLKKQADIRNLKEQINNIGIKSGIEKELDKLVLEKDVLSKELNWSEDDIITLNSLITDRNELNNSKTKLEY